MISIRFYLIKNDIKRVDGGDSWPILRVITLEERRPCDWKVRLKTNKFGGLWVPSVRKDSEVYRQCQGHHLQGIFVVRVSVLRISFEDFHRGLAGGAESLHPRILRHGDKGLIRQVTGIQRIKISRKGRQQAKHMDRPHSLTEKDRSRDIETLHLAQEQNLWICDPQHNWSQTWHQEREEAEIQCQVWEVYNQQP